MVERVVPSPIDAEALADVRTAVPTDGTLLAIAEAFRALADPTRVRILLALSKRPLCVRDLALLAQVSESAVSHQLRWLRNRRLVAPERKGRVISYSVKDCHLVALLWEAERHAVNHVAVPGGGRGMAQMGG